MIESLGANNQNNGLSSSEEMQRASTSSSVVISHQKDVCEFPHNPSKLSNFIIFSS